MSSSDYNQEMEDQDSLDGALTERDDLEQVSEEGSDLTEIGQPYDPTKTKIDSDRVSLDGLIRRLRHGEIDLQPDFQRLGHLWSDEKKSRLIESLLIRIPLPAFYFDGTDDDKWLVVDGLQRLSTLQSFVVDVEDPTKRPLRLTGLEYLTQLNGMTFKELPRPMSRRIEETQVTLHIIRPGTPAEVKYNIFRRINTGGIVLTPQEIRHALNPGPVLKFLRDLAQSPEFRRATTRGISPKRMGDREFALRFCAFTMRPYSTYKEANMDRFLTNAMDELNRASERVRGELRDRYFRALNTAHAIFGDDAFRKRFDREAARMPINKALFEVWSVQLGALTAEQQKDLIRRREALKERHLMALQNNDFVTAISQGTGDVSKVRMRFQVVEQLITDVLLLPVDNEVAADTGGADA